MSIYEALTQFKSFAEKLDKEQKHETLHQAYALFETYITLEITSIKLECAELFNSSFVVPMFESRMEVESETRRARNKLFKLIGHPISKE